MSTPAQARTPSDDAEVQRERYRELLEELRTVNPGVQVLLGFLLTVPFASRFTELDRMGRISFTVCLVSTAVAALMFMAPTSYHRLAERTDRDQRIRAAVRMALAGMAALAVSITSGIYVVVRFVYGTATGGVVAMAVGTLIVLLWYALPLSRRIRQGSQAR